jgi:DNA-binding XRE family transcriptional regulator
VESRHWLTCLLGSDGTTPTLIKEGSKMGRSTDHIVALLPHDHQVVTDARQQDMTREIEGLRELRQIAGKAQSDIASALNITQPSVSKIEKQTDMHLSTLRNYVEAVGGELELTVKMPERPALRIHHLGELTPIGAEPVRKKSDAPSPRRRHG